MISSEEIDVLKKNIEKAKPNQLHVIKDILKNKNVILTGNENDLVFDVRNITLETFSLVNVIFEFDKDKIANEDVSKDNNDKKNDNGENANQIQNQIKTLNPGKPSLQSSSSSNEKRQIRIAFADTTKDDEDDDNTFSKTFSSTVQPTQVRMKKKIRDALKKILKHKHVYVEKDYGHDVNIEGDNDDGYVDEDNGTVGDEEGDIGTVDNEIVDKDDDDDDEDDNKNEVSKLSSVSPGKYKNDENDIDVNPDEQTDIDTDGETDALDDASVNDPDIGFDDVSTNIVELNTHLQESKIMENEDKINFSIDGMKERFNHFQKILSTTKFGTLDNLGM